MLCFKGIFFECGLARGDSASWWGMKMKNTTCLCRSVFGAMPVTLLVLLPSTSLAQSTLPENPSVIAGDISISSTSTAQTIQQDGATGIINWGSFSIGEKNSVTFENGNGATLNRVTGSEGSNILGQLNATGSVYVLNKNGVFFGPNGAVRTGGDFVASTLDVSNEDFLNGGDTLFSGDSGATILNYGEIGSLGGNVALIARSVFNEGIIEAPNGTGALVAGREVLMRDIALDHGMFVVRVGGEDTSVTDKGSISAAEAELRANGGNIYALAGNTSGTIKATGVTKKGGRVFLTAPGGRVETSKSISARNGDGSGGTIRVNAANIEASNLYDASASSGKGGFVELFATAEAAFSGRILAFGDGTPEMGGFAEVSGVQMLRYSGSTDTGGGTLLLDPNNIEINSEAQNLSSSSLIDVDDLTSDLSSQNVIIQTSGVDGQAGTIYVGVGVEYDSSFDLTFLAHGDIFIDSPVQNLGSGDINLVAGWDGSTSTLAFDPSVFRSADLFNPVIFGNENGLSYSIFGNNIVADGSVELSPDFLDTAVGTVGGELNVFANNVYLTAVEESGFALAAMLGARVDNSFNDGTRPIISDIEVRAAGDIVLEGATQEGGFVQIGHVGSAVSTSGGENSASATGNINIEAAGDISLDAGENNGAYAQIGHGSIDSCAPIDCSQSGGTRVGDINIFSDAEISLEDGLFSDPDGARTIFAWIGHGTINRADVSSASIEVTAASFDQNVSTSNNPGDLGRFNPDIISEGLDGGFFGLYATETGLEFTSGSIDSADGDLLIDVANSLQFGTGFNFNDSGNDGQYVLSTQERFFNLEGADLFDIGSGLWVVYSERPDQDTGGLRVLTPDLVVYDETLDLADPLLLNFRDREGNPLPADQNMLVYAIDPVLTVNNAAAIYGQDSELAPTFTFTLDGVAVDPTTFGVDNLGVEIDEDLVVRSTSGFVNVSTYNEALVAFYDSPTFNDLYLSQELGNLTIDPATIVVSLADELKETGTGYTGDVTYSGFVVGEDDSLISSTPTFGYTGGDGSDGIAPGTYTVSGSGSSETSGNYIFDETDTAELIIVAGDGGEQGGGESEEEEPTGELPEVPRNENPSTFGNEIPAPPVLVNGVSDESDGQGSDGNGFIEVSPANTTQIVQDLQKGREFCEGLAQQEYVIDCMGDSLAAAAESLPEGGDYAAVKAALTDASEKLEALARQNASQTLTRGLVQANGQQSSRRFTPVASEALASLNAQAVAIIDEAQTVLLRSAQNSDRRKIHYQQIAEAVGSNKILLRST